MCSYWVPSLSLLQSDFLDFYVSYLREIPECLSVISMLASGSVPSSAFLEVTQLAWCQYLTSNYDLLSGFADIFWLASSVWHTGRWIQALSSWSASSASSEDPRLPAAAAGQLISRPVLQTTPAALSLMLCVQGLLKQTEAEHPDYYLLLVCTQQLRSFTSQYHHLLQHNQELLLHNHKEVKRLALILFNKTNTSTLRRKRGRMSTRAVICITGLP